MEAIRDAESLVRRVGRAFYTDEIVLILDVLVNDKYIREDEMTKRLAMSAKQARGLLQYLMISEKLVKNETLTSNEDDEKKKQIVYWYIDFESFTNVVALRIHLLQENVQKKSKTAKDLVYFKCQRCQTQYLELEAVRQNFQCDQRLCEGENDAILIEVGDGNDDSSEILRIKKLVDKIESQIGIDDGRPTIFELLSRLQGKPLPNNLPSRNRASGLGGATLFAGQSSSNKSENAGGGFSLFRLNAKGMRVQVIIDDDDTEEDDIFNIQDRHHESKKRKIQETNKTQLPDFIANSSHRPTENTRTETNLSDDEYVAWVDGDANDDDVKHNHAIHQPILPIASRASRQPFASPRLDTTTPAQISFSSSTSSKPIVNSVYPVGSASNSSSNQEHQQQPKPQHVHFSFNGTGSNTQKKKPTTTVKFNLRPPSR
mmetsp:Transcript_6425/g.9038  ORF Transcript_6425/g.9038 Transcript_6425/m.9038 type:complete len:430 (+) Transcript_6425:161-1450(+)